MRFLTIGRSGGGGGVTGGEGPFDHVFDRGLLDAEVEDVEVGEETPGHFGCLRTGHRQDRLRRCGLFDLPVAGQVGEVPGDPDGDRLLGAETLRQLGQVAVEEQRTAVDHDHPLAEGGHVGHVVAGQQHRRPFIGGVGGDEAADPLLHRQVETEGGFVEEQHRRGGEEGGEDLDLHPFPEGEVVHRLGEEVADVQQLGEPLPAGPVVGVGDPVDGLADVEGVGDRKVPHQRVAVPHDERRPGEELGVAGGGVEADHPGVTCRRIEETRQHLQGGRLPRPVGPEETDDLAGLEAERHRPDGLDIPVLAVDQGPQRRHQPLLAYRDLEGLRQVLDHRRRHVGRSPFCRSRGWQVGTVGAQGFLVEWRCGPVDGGLEPRAGSHRRCGLGPGFVAFVGRQPPPRGSRALGWLTRRAESFHLLGAKRSLRSSLTGVCVCHILREGWAGGAWTEGRSSP